MRKPPRPHRVNPKDPRYSTSIRARGYQRGTGETVSHTNTIENNSIWRDRYFSLFTKQPPYREPVNLKHVPDEEWRYAYMLEKAGRGHENALRYIDPTTTATPMFDNMLENPDYFLKNKGKSFEIIWMSPSQYFEMCARNREEYTGKYASALNERSMVDDIRARQYANLMEGGTYFPMPNIDEYGGQEGRHRARALEMLGVTRFPVMRIKQVD